MVEKETGLRTCVIYGALPPEMRRLQARLFNDRDNEYTVLVASDAVGMGLNLNIRRIIFHTLEKYDGERWDWSMSLPMPAPRSSLQNLLLARTEWRHQWRLPNPVEIAS